MVKTWLRLIQPIDLLLMKGSQKSWAFKIRQRLLAFPVDMWGKKAVITGVIKDFNATPLQNELSPVIIMAGTTFVLYWGSPVKYE
jgi:hypothetical protein